MNQEKFKQLESLLGELQVFLGHNYCIVPNHVQDGYYIALYNEKGDRFVGVSGPFLLAAAQQAKDKTKDHGATEVPGA